MKKIPLIVDFFEALNSRGIEYCHWKSNHLIKSFLEGEGDLDVLVSDRSQKDFQDILLEYKFKSTTSPTWKHTSSVYHYYGLDEETGKIVHVHAYFKLVTGGNLIKNYHFPLAATLLIERSSEYDGINIPDRSSELLTFVIRKILECGSTPDFLFTSREAEIINKEFNWLLDSTTLTEAKALLPKFFPELNADLFNECILALQSKPQYFRWLSLSKKLHKVFSGYSLNSPIKNTWMTWIKFYHVLFHKFFSKKSVSNFSSGGAFIAFIGADGSGKSTHVSNTTKWLGKFVMTTRIHSGKPPATWLTFIPRIFLPALRKLFPNQRSNFIELKHHTYDPQEYKNASYSIIFLVRSIMIAYDRRKLINKAHRRAGNGEIIISDRFPSMALGGMDGLRVDPDFFENRNSFKYFLARIVKNVYSSISGPTLVFKLDVSPQVTLKRLTERDEETDTELEQLIECRKAVVDKWEFPDVPVHVIDNSTSFSDVEKEIKKIIWQSI